jgi:hypothetical protein
VISTEVINATSGGGLIKTGAGTTASPFTLGIADNGVTSARIENGAVTADDLATGAVTLDKMATGSVNSAKIVDASIATADLANGAVTAAKLDAMSATANQALVYNGSAWAPTTLSAVALASGSSSNDYIIVYNGAYNGPAAGTYTSGLNGSFSAGWTNSVFIAQNKDLLWAPVDAASATVTWTIASSSCPTDWRLPNLKELQVLYEAMGGHGGYARGFYAMAAAGKGSAPVGCEPMQSGFYWSSTESSSDVAYYFGFATGFRNYSSKTGNNLFVRCVRSL